MSDAPLPVSVAIPAWNREREVVEAVASARAQIRPAAEILEVGLFDPTFGHAEDRELGLRLLARTDAVMIEQPLVRYRAHPGGASADALRMTLGAVTVADRVLAAPERYPPGATDYFTRARPEQLRQAAVLLMERDRFAEARRYFARSLRERLSVRSLAGLIVASLGRPVYRGLVRLKRGAGLPGLRGGR